MSMCLYLKSASELELMRMVREPDTLAAMAMPAGADLADAARELSAGAFSAEALEQQVETLQRELRRQGWRGRIIGWLMARQMRHEHAQVRSQFDRLMRSGGSAASDADRPLDLHKSWHMLHFLFTGTAWEGDAPANTLLAGGRSVGGDLGYGPARFVSAAETSAFDRYLSSLSLSALERRIDPGAMARLEIYCTDMDDGDASELVDDVEHYFPRLKDYVASAATRGHGMAIWMM